MAKIQITSKWSFVRGECRCLLRIPHRSKASPDKAQGEVLTLEKRLRTPSSNRKAKPQGRHCSLGWQISLFITDKTIPVSSFQSKCRLNFFMHHGCFESTIEFSKSSVSNIIGLFLCGKPCAAFGLDCLHTLFPLFVMPFSFFTWIKPSPKEEQLLSKLATSQMGWVSMSGYPGPAVTPIS